MSGVRAVPHAKAQPLPLVLSALPTPMVSRKRHESAMNRVTDRGVRNGSAASCQRESKGERVLCPFDLREHTRCASRGKAELNVHIVVLYLGDPCSVYSFQERFGMAETSTPIEVLCCHSRTDEKWLRKLESHLSLLRRQG